MNKIDFRIIRPDSIGILHDSRKDVKTLAKVCNHLIDKVNELIDENQRKKYRLIGIAIVIKTVTAPQTLCVG